MPALTPRATPVRADDTALLHVLKAYIETLKAENARSLPLTLGWCTLCLSHYSSYDRAAAVVTSIVVLLPRPPRGRRTTASARATVGTARPTRRKPIAASQPP
jgi:hypothetical protein